MMLLLLLICFVSLLGMWLTVVFILPGKIRLWLAQHPFVFLLIHIPFMVFMTSVGGEGLMFGVSNLAAGLLAQVILAYWGVHRHGLTWGGKKTEVFFELHPRLMDVDVVRRYVQVKRVAMGYPDNRKAGVS